MVVAVDTVVVVVDMAVVAAAMVVGATGVVVVGIKSLPPSSVPVSIIKVR